MAQSKNMLSIDTIDKYWLLATTSVLIWISANIFVLVHYYLLMQYSWVTQICHEGLKPLFHQLDIIDLNSLKTAAAFFKEKYGGVDILINNAGIGFKATDTTPFGIQAEVTLRTNFFGTRDVLTHFMPLIKAEVNVSSIVSSSTLSQ
ncbi:carbonyl reductase [NADPH] 1-like isoform X1 [Poecilia reticulata]|uniref:carbonyl reductase [NADPH] 1-like isoform X1 n=1 Tax=Poecilia reticulata TaxID=8081 RepID=UPI0007EAAB2B|nr:PREDICTED: carbonyl reductase [NADPH] 1-like isoform X1 [Poecilia reticulata]